MTDTRVLQRVVKRTVLIISGEARLLLSALFFFTFVSVLPLCPLKNGTTPFRRIRDEEIEVDPRLADNSFKAKVGHSDSFIHAYYWRLF